MEIIHAPQKANLENKKVIFLAGPIRCAQNWQQLFIDGVAEHVRNMPFEYHSKVNNLVIANPRRAEGEVPKKDFDYMMFKEQTDWEIEYLAAAGKNGFVTFFLAAQSVPDTEQSYARTTRFELGEWFGEIKNRNDVKIIIGYDKNFPGFTYILTRINDFRERFPYKAHQIILCDEGFEAYTNTIHQEIVKS